MEIDSEPEVEIIGWSKPASRSKPNSVSCARHLRFFHDILTVLRIFSNEPILCSICYINLDTYTIDQRQRHYENNHFSESCEPYCFPSFFLPFCRSTQRP